MQPFAPSNYTFLRKAQFLWDRSASNVFRCTTDLDPFQEKIGKCMIDKDSAGCRYESSALGVGVEPISDLGRSIRAIYIFKSDDADQIPLLEETGCETIATGELRQLGSDEVFGFLNRIDLIHPGTPVQKTIVVLLHKLKELSRVAFPEYL